MEKIKLSKYATWYYNHMGFNFRNKVTGKIMPKPGYYDIYNGAITGEWEPIEYEPRNGWLSEAEKKDHHDTLREQNLFI